MDVQCWHTQWWWRLWRITRVGLFTECWACTHDLSPGSQYGAAQASLSDHGSGRSKHGSSCSFLGATVLKKCACLFILTIFFLSLKSLWLLSFLELHSVPQQGFIKLVPFLLSLASYLAGVLLVEGIWPCWMIGMPSTHKGYWDLWPPLLVCIYIAWFLKNRFFLVRHVCFWDRRQRQGKLWGIVSDIDSCKSIRVWLEYSV